MIRTTTRTTAFIVLSSAAAVFALTGCKADPYATDYNSIKSNLTPELTGLSERQVDREINWAQNANQDLRAATDDWGRLWLTDQPSRLSPYPIMSTSGNP